MRIVTFVGVVVAVGLITTLGQAQDAPPSDAAPAALDQAALEQQFAENMTGVKLTGFFTLGRHKAGEPLRQDSYTISRMTKLAGDLWQMDVRIDFGETDVTLPIALPIKWAGDTPVITVDNVGFPGIGSYNARVMIYKDEYAGTWGSADGGHGGQMFGTIEKIEQPEGE